MREMLKSKVHRARVTDTSLDYEGSITLDADLMEAADILPYELVHVLDINNGARIITYAIAGERGSGTVCINGAAARLVLRDHLVIVLAFHHIDDEAAAWASPRLVYVDENNKIIRKR